MTYIPCLTSSTAWVTTYVRILKADSPVQSPLACCSVAPYAEPPEMATLQQLGQLALAQTRYNELIQFYTHNVTPTTAAMLGTSQINTAALLQQMFGMAQVPRGLDMLLRYFFYWVQDTRPYNQPVIPFPGAHPAVRALSALAEMLNKPEQERRRVLRRMSEFAKHVAIFLVYPSEALYTPRPTFDILQVISANKMSLQCGQPPLTRILDNPSLEPEARVCPLKNDIGSVWRGMVIDASSRVHSMRIYSLRASRRRGPDRPWTTMGTFSYRVRKSLTSSKQLT